MTKTKSKVKKEPLTKFRVHFRTSDTSTKHKMDVDAKDIGAAHEAIFSKYRTDTVRVFIDKVKVLGENA